MKSFIVLCTFFLALSSSYSQKQANHWFFGDHIGLDFSSSTPVFEMNGQTDMIGCPACHAEGSSSISDSSGTLLFYTNGNKVWNRNHQLMPNGSNLLSTASSTQSSLILPLPDSDRYFYVFTTDAFFGNELAGGCRYSVVDMCLEDGMGDVSAEEKNILLENTMAEKLTAVRHSNGIDTWIIAHKYFSDEFVSFLLTTNGITDTVYSAIGSTHPTGTTNTGAAIGQMKSSPDGTKIAIVNGNQSNAIFEYFDFDSSTGILSNHVDLQWDPNYHFYGVSFSPDNLKLYVACMLNGNGIYQFDLSAGGGNPPDIIASRVQIADYFNYYGMQLANNGKIYGARSPNIGHTYLYSIEEPNLAGLACNFLDSAVYTNGMGVGLGVPTFLESFDYSNNETSCGLTTNEINAAQSTIFPNPASDFISFELNQGQIIHELIISDLSGRIIKEFKGNSTNKLLVDVLDVEKGQYVYEVLIKGGNSITGKLSVSK